MVSLRPSPQTTAKLSLTPARRYLALYLPRWATDCLKRADPALRASARPLVLWEKQKGAMRLAAVDAAATAAGLFAGQNLSDARAVCPDLEAREIDRPRLEQIFGDFADWHSNASPVVSVLTDQSAYGDLCLDITGVDHIFGGEERMLGALLGRLEALGFTVSGAIASTVGAAWALAHFSPGRIIAEGDETKALGPLPVAALRLDGQQVEGLAHLGLRRVSEVYGRSRSALQARFGTSLLLRLDQALGWVEEKLTPRFPSTEYYTDRRFADPIGLMDDVLACTHDLAIRLGLALEQDGMGAQGFHLYLYRVDHKVISLSVTASRATRDAFHISRLFSFRAERLEAEYDPGFGIDMIRLAADTVSPVSIDQLGVFEDQEGAVSLDRLYDRMTNRLGLPAVVRTSFINSHIPERAVKLEPVVVRAAEPDIRPIAVPRPLRLLPAPEPITVSLARVPDGAPPNMVWRRVTYRFVRNSGPERIAAEWWQSEERLMLTAETMEKAVEQETPERYYREGEATRDYFLAEDDGGRRFWIFRAGLFGVAGMPKWFLHGFFA